MLINKKYLPSKKFTISLILALIIIAISLILTFGKGTLYESKNNSVISGDTSFETFKQVDTDKDGLPDWQETLYGTDPKKMDSDEDGTNDEEELKINRDPLKANTASLNKEPNDKIDPQIIVEEKKIEAEYENLNDTQKLARSFLSEYLASQPADRQMTSSEINDFVNKMISDVNIEDIEDKYIEKDVKITNDKEESFIKYFTEIEKILSNDVVPATMSSLDLITSLEKNKWVINTKKITDLTKTIRIASEKIINTEVPEILITEHLSLVNDIYKISAYVESFNKLNEDPIKSMVGLQGCIELIARIGETFDQMDLKLNYI